jgi:HAD superfamily hydrolase (TIGR01509 family)
VTFGAGTPGPIDAIIFDMDGVLVDSEPLHARATKLLLAERGLHWDERESAEYIGLTDVESFAALVRRHGLPDDPLDLAARWAERAILLLEQHARPLPGVPSVPVTLRSRGYRLALASSSRPRVIAATLDAIGVRSLFEVVVSGAEVPRGKPSPDIFLETARRLGLSPGRCVVIEDSRHGVTAARAAGMHCIAIPCSTTAHQDFTHATTRLATLPEVFNYLDLMRPAA